MYLARKYTGGKWRNFTDLPVGSVPGDASYDIRTQDNALSVWCRPDDSARSTENVALALAAGFDRLDKIDILWVGKSALEDLGFKIVASDGRTPVKSLVNLHFDIVGLSFSELSRLAGVFADSISHDMACTLV